MYRKDIIRKIWVIYAKYFNVKFLKQDDSWTPHIICSACHAMLYKCEDSGIDGSLKLTVPAIWKKPQNE